MPLHFLHLPRSGCGLPVWGSSHTGMVVEEEEQTMECNTFEMELAGRKLVVEIGSMREQADGACLIRCGDTAVMVTATMSKQPRAGIDFFPLSVEFEERSCIPWAKSPAGSSSGRVDRRRRRS